MATLEQLLKNETAGDPISGLKWKNKSLRKIAKRLRWSGIKAKKDTIAKLLKELRYSLRVNRKKLSLDGIKAVDKKKRNKQFQYIHRIKREFVQQGNPVISVDAKKKELIGKFKNPGASWQKRPFDVYDHDFSNYADGIGIPYGIYDTQANQGSIFVGTSHDTPAFAVDCIVKWWQVEGQHRYPNASKLLILADSGGSNGRRIKAWKYHLQHKLCNPYGLSVTVCHYPPGASKWNPIEHRLFSEISKNWRGKPLTSYEVMLKHIRSTKTSSGLKVRSFLIKKQYLTGEKISNAQMAILSIFRHETFPQWNYTLMPR